jgi:hypothetical protein
MRTNFCALVVFATLMFSIDSFGQHGPAGAGRPSGVGPSNTGRPTMSEPGMNRASAGSMSSQSPTTLLTNNSHLNTALTNTLQKSGISIPGGSLQSACDGFKNLGQCVAAMHVSKNLDIQGGFDALKAKMTGSNSISLGQAIQQLDPNADAKKESKKATKQANQDISTADSQW